MGLDDHRRTAPIPRARAACWASPQSPRSSGEMRPCGSTAVASMMSMPAPDRARLPRCMTCQSVALPSSAEYWHMGATTIRFFRLTGPSLMEEKRILITQPVFFVRNTLFLSSHSHFLYPRGGGGAMSPGSANTASVPFAKIPRGERQDDNRLRPCYRASWNGSFLSLRSLE